MKNEKIVIVSGYFDPLHIGHLEFIFCNGGDRHLEEIPETEVCEKLGIQMVDGLGDKIRSSSDLTGLKETEYYDND